MDLTNKNKITSVQEPTKNTQKKALPPEANNFGYMGADTGVKGRMGDYSAGVTNTE